MQKRVTKYQWLQAALDSLLAHGVNGISIERLAQTLGTSKSGFYWHFNNKDDLLENILTYWESEFTDTVINSNSQQPESAEKKLQLISDMIMDHQLGRYDMPLRTWGNEDNSVRKRINKTDRKRLGYISSVFKELGFRGAEPENRASLFILYHAFLDSMFLDDSTEKRRKKVRAYNKLLMKK